MADTQISAYVSDTTKELVERYVEAHGVKKGRLIEEALLHHLQALRVAGRLDHPTSNRGGAGDLRARGRAGEAPSKADEGAP